MTIPCVLSCSGLEMTYADPDGPPRRVLQGVDLELGPGETVALLGRSGSGKSTLLHLAAGISLPTAGTVAIAGLPLAGMSEGRRAELRRSRVGLVFQFFHLLPHLDVAENVALPGWIAGRGGTELGQRVGDLLERVGLADRAGDPVGRLSGGEMQRVAICRALLNQPILMLADEPTGSLDDRTGAQVLDLLFDICRQDGRALLFATHSRELARRADRLLELHDGRLGPAPGPGS